MAATKPEASAEAPAAEAEGEDAEGFGSSDVLLDSVTKDEWKSIEVALSYQKKNVAEMLKRACSQVRTKGELQLDDTNGRFLSDLLPEMENFASWCYKEHIRPKLISLPLALPDVSEGDTKNKGGGGKKGGGGGKGKGGKGKEEKIPAKTQIKIDNVMRIMNGEAAKDKGKKAQIGDKTIGWLEALEVGKNLVVDAPWELQLAKEMGVAAGVLSKKKGEGEKDSEEARYRSVRNLADAIVVFETQYKLRYGTEVTPSNQLVVDARAALGMLKVKVKFTVHKCLRKHPALLSSSQFKARHAAKFLQPYPSQLQLFKSISKPGPRLVLLRSPPDTGKTSLAPSLPELFPDMKIIFCCLARRVNLEVAQTLYNMGIPFAWVHSMQVTCSWLCGLRGSSTSNSVAQMDEKLRLGIERINQTSGGLTNSKVRTRHKQVIRHPRMFVTDVASCAWLSRQLDPSKTVLMIDEPTMGADQGNGQAMAASSLTGYMVQGILDSPYKTIWSSATLPPGASLPLEVNHFKGRFGVGDDAVDELVSMQLNVGVLLVKASGQVALPHEMCAEGSGSPSENLQDFVGRLQVEPLLLKAYTAQAIVSMQDRLEEEDVSELATKANFSVVPIDEYFEDLSKLSHSSLRHYAVEILSALANTKDDALIKAACTPSADQAKALFPPFDTKKLLLQNASCFPGMTLTVSANPMAQISETAEALVKEMPSLKKLNKEIEAQEAALEKQLAQIRKEAEKVKGGDDRVEEIIAQKMRDLGVSDTAGSLKIPEHCVVNSRAHMRKYAPDLVGEFDGSFFRNVPTQIEFKKVDTLPVEEMWRMLLLSGVAAHVPLEPALNPKGDTGYTNYVAEQMERGALAVCGVTKDFTYGANVPCTSVVVDSVFINNHSANTLRQFIGRVARTGLAPFGVAQFEDDSFLLKMCGKQDQQEAQCMEATAKALIAAANQGSYADEPEHDCCEMQSSPEALTSLESNSAAVQHACEKADNENAQ